MDRISGIVVLLLGAAILWQGRHLTTGSLRSPGPGFFPFLLAAVMIILALFLIVPGKKKESARESSAFPSIGRVSIVFIALLVYFFFLESLGFVIVSFFLMAFLFIVMASQKWHLALLQSFIFVGLAYVLFEVLLKSQIPRGVMGF
jgi:putative tricarboxylic transport membrane protein